MKDPIDRTKVVLRHLPPALSQAVLLQQIDSRFADRYSWFSFRPAKSCQKRQLYSRAYINFKEPEDVLEFAESFDGHTFVNEKGSQFKTIVEYAPSQRIPKPLTKKDGRDGMIYKDPEYVEFLEQLAKPIENLPSAEIQLERKEAVRAGQPKEIIITTPLMDFVRQKRAAKGAPQRSSTNGKLSRRTSTALPSSSSGSAKRASDKRKGPTSMYVLRDSSKNANKEKSPYLLIRKKEDYQLSDNPSSSAADTAKNETALVRGEMVSGVDIGKGKVVFLKGRPKDSSFILGDAHQQHNIAISKQALCREASGRIIRSTDKELQQSQLTAGAGLPEQQTLSRERDKRPPRPTNIRSLVKDHISNMSAADSDLRKAAHDKAANSDLHSSGPVNERHDRRTRHRDRPDRVVWAPLRRSDGSLVGADSHSQLLTDSFEGKAGVDTEDNIVVSTSSLAGAKSRNSEARNNTTHLGRGVTGGQDLGNLKDDAFPSKISEVQSLGSGRNSIFSVENGSHRHGGRRGLSHGLKESDVAANISEGKHAPRRGNTSYISHEKQVWVQKSNMGS